MHINNKKCKFHQDSFKFINQIKDDKYIVFGVDGKISNNFNKTNSIIICEYHEFIPRQSYSFYILTRLFSTKRIKFFNRKVPQSIKKIIESYISSSEPVDRLFVRITNNVNTKILISHDYSDYKKRTRKIIKNKLNIFIINSKEFLKDYY